jgi:hypothetical protein
MKINHKRLLSITNSLKGLSFFLDVSRHQQATQLKNWIEQLGGVRISLQKERRIDAFDV